MKLLILTLLISLLNFGLIFGSQSFAKSSNQFEKYISVVDQFFNVWDSKLEDLQFTSDCKVSSHKKFIVDLKHYKMNYLREWSHVQKKYAKFGSSQKGLSLIVSRRNSIENKFFDKLSASADANLGECYPK